jgi:16S rRNA (guanine527-N7)-methyltransferase
MTPGDIPADVPRETSAPPAPAEATQVLGSSLERMRGYADLLVQVGVAYGLLGPREIPRLWERHLLNCAVVAPALPVGASVVDVGSGAGLPGLVWAVMRPDLEIFLLEPLLRRADFLTAAVQRLGLSAVTVDRCRAEDARGRYAVDVVTARAVAPLERLLGWTMPLLRPGGRLLALKGRTADAEVAKAGRALAVSGGTSVRVCTYGEGVLDPPTTVVEVTAAGGDIHPPRVQEENRGRRSP